RALAEAVDLTELGDTRCVVTAPREHGGRRVDDGVATLVPLRAALRLVVRRRVHHRPRRYLAAGGHQRPCHSGGRRSTNARKPSSASSVASSSSKRSFDTWRSV